MINRPRIKIEIDNNNIEYTKKELNDINHRLSYITKYDTLNITNQFSKIVGNQRKQQCFNTNQNIFYQGIPFILDK
jgi:hypothetical protein